MRKMFYKLIILTVTFCVLFISDSFSQEKVSVKDTQAILITSAMRELFNAPKPKGDEALLITDKTEVSRFIKLFDGNYKTRLHACGYHWRISFLNGSNELTDIWFNQDCEEFKRSTAEICETVQAKFSQIKNNPTHFITEIGISADISPDEVLKELRPNQNFFPVVLGDLDKRFPSIEIDAKAVSVIPENRKLWEKAKKETWDKAAKILLDEANLLGKDFPIVKKGEVDRQMSTFGGGQIEEHLKLKIFFSVGTELDQIESKLPTTKLIGKTEPKVYFLQIVGKERFSNSMAQQLGKDFPFIKESFAYESYPR